MAKEAREKKQLEKIKARRDNRELKRKEKAQRELEKAEHDKEKYEEPSSDPYIVFSIDPPINPGCKIFRHGGYFGRKASYGMIRKEETDTGWGERLRRKRVGGRGGVGG